MPKISCECRMRVNNIATPPNQLKRDFVFLLPSHLFLAVSGESRSIEPLSDDAVATQLCVNFAYFASLVRASVGNHNTMIRYDKGSRSTISISLPIDCT